MPKHVLALFFKEKLLLGNKISVEREGLKDQQQSIGGNNTMNDQFLGIMTTTEIA